LISAWLNAIFDLGRRRGAKPATNFLWLKEIGSHRANNLRRIRFAFDELDVGWARRAEAIRRASTSVAGPIHCELAMAFFRLTRTKAASFFISSPPLDHEDQRN